MQAVIPKELEDQAQLMGHVTLFAFVGSVPGSGHQAARHGPLSTVCECSELCLHSSGMAHVAPFHAWSGMCMETCHVAHLHGAHACGLLYLWMDECTHMWWGKNETIERIK